MKEQKRKELRLNAWANCNRDIIGLLVDRPDLVELIRVMVGRQQQVKTQPRSG